MSDRVKGKIKWFNAKRGYGFIGLENGDVEVFVHSSAIEGDSYLKIEAGQKVEFSIEESSKGTQAARVVAL